MTNTHTYPEALSRKDVPDGVQPWTVQGGKPLRGEAWTDIEARKMAVPLGDHPAARAIRVHEMMHAKVSPLSLYLDGRYEVPTESIIAAEELKVNTLAQRAGFDMFDLRDGSERQSGEILAKAKDWNSAVRTLTTMAGTPAASDFISGVGSVNEDMANALTEVAEVLRKEIRSMDTFDLGNTSPSDEWRLPTDGPGEGFHPAGFWHTLSLARLVESLMSGDGQAGKAGTLPTPEGVRRQATRHPKGEFAKMILDDDVTLDVAIDGVIGRKYRSSDTGTDPVNIHRLLEDPARRVFRRKVRVPSAVILIDQSGSMSLSTEDVWDMIQKAPGATIIGYSHEPGSDTVPNVWVLAHKGRATSTVCGGNGGNGVDGPAVEFAQSLRKRNDPFIWVCDGDVTSKDDGSAVNLTNDAVTLALDYGIHMVYNVDEALRALQCLAKGGRLKTRLTGAMDSHARYLVALSADDDYDPDYVPDYAPDYIPYVAADDDDDDYYEEEDHSDDENPSGWGQDEEEEEEEDDDDYDDYEE